MRCYTAIPGKIEDGIELVSQTYASGRTATVVAIGETGRGRTLTVVPVDGSAPDPCPYRGKHIWPGGGAQRKSVNGPVVCPRCGIDLGEGKVQEGCSALSWEHPQDGTVPQGRVGYAQIVGRGDAVRFLADDDDGDDDRVLVMFRTPIGFRGSNRHSGDHTGEWECRDCNSTGPGRAPDTCQECGAIASMFGGPRNNYYDLPGNVIASGDIAQGDAGRAGSGSQYLIVLSPGDIVRVTRTGRLYGAEPTWFYKALPGGGLDIASWDERKNTRCW